MHQFEIPRRSSEKFTFGLDLEIRLRVEPDYNFENPKVASFPSYTVHKIFRKLDFWSRSLGFGVAHKSIGGVMEALSTNFS